MKHILLTALVFFQGLNFSYSQVNFERNKPITFSINAKESEVVKTALEIFSKDFKAVFEAGLVNNERALLTISTVSLHKKAYSKLSQVQKQWIDTVHEGFILKVIDNQLYIVGSDKRGTAYGILELSRLIGVSPWEWWADSEILSRESFSLENGFELMQSPSVDFRGIFINDEDWGLLPWSTKTFEPTTFPGRIGPKTHARIFELLLRLRANTLWPAMHSCSEAFFKGPGNKEMADKYGILIGTSHCEPMLRNANAEWKIDGKGSYDFVHNRKSVVDFWKDRVEQQKNSDNIYTLGIRGVHDGKMEGANTLEEQKIALDEVLATQRQMLKTMVNENLEEIPQVFVPYKEVLDVYNMGLKVPEDVSLIWCDDNYGYIKHFPTTEEAARKGGNGVYYHVSYWGRPHDYLWLATNHPAQLYAQMKLAYEKGADKMWILNVGDIKPAEYLTELFMDMAWNMKDIEASKAGLNAHLLQWLTREFGGITAQAVLPLMEEYYRLSYIRKPEFMGNTRTEESNPQYKVVKDLGWTKEYVEQRLQECQTLAVKVVELSSQIPASKKDAWFELVEYPLRAAAEMNIKHLNANLARHGLADWALSDKAFDSIASLTQKYNSLQNGKWKGMMDVQPRRLEVFDRIPKVQSEGNLPVEKKTIACLNGNEYKSFSGEKPMCLGMGYGNGAVHLEQNTALEYTFESTYSDTLEIQFALAPNHPVVGDHLRFEVSFDGGKAETIDYATHGRSEEWKMNVTRNQSLKTLRFTSIPAGYHTILFKALDPGVVLDQITIR